MPRPNETFPASSRVTSSSSGRSNCSGSRFAPPITIATPDRLGATLSPSSTSSSAIRRSTCTGESYRTSSSTAFPSRSG